MVYFMIKRPTWDHLHVHVTVGEKRDHLRDDIHVPDNDHAIGPLTTVS